MAKKQILFKTKGMNRDLSVSAFNPEFSFENINLRLSTNEGNTLMSWVNERGPQRIKIVEEDDGEATSTEIHIVGVAIGKAVLNEYLVLFVATGGTDFIYRLKYSNDEKTEMQCKKLYQGDLGFDLEHPIETLVSWEADLIQKVYWVDGHNQARVINISPKYDDVDYSSLITPFDFVPKLKLQEEVYVLKTVGTNGSFSPGVLQYSFTYYRKYGQESNIFYTTPLQYISHKDRGASPEETSVDVSFKITITGVDKENYDYLRIYSIQRTSLDTVPYAKRVVDIPLSNSASIIEYTDTGLSGDAVDPTELLYKANTPIAPYTITQKDQTLFLGNYTILREYIETTLKSSIQSALQLKNYNLNSLRLLTKQYDFIGQASGYKYFNQLNCTVPYTVTVGDTSTSYLNNEPCCGFRQGNWYRLGVQFQHQTGEWTSPIVVGDTYDNSMQPTISESQVGLPRFRRLIDSTATVSQTDSRNLLNVLKNLGYQKVRPVYVVPSIYDRFIMCQGVTSPTMYTRYGAYGEADYSSGSVSYSLSNGTLHGQSSWFFRPWESEEYGQYNYSEFRTVPLGYSNTDRNPSVGDYPLDAKLKTGFQFKTGDGNPIPVFPEIYGIFTDSTRGTLNISNKFRMGCELHTFHSPDIDASSAMQAVDFSSAKYRLSGWETVTKTFSDIEIETSSPTIGKNHGAVRKKLESDGMYGIASGLFYIDDVVDDNGDNPTKFEAYDRGPCKWLVYLWQRRGSLNNDVGERPTDGGVASAHLKTKAVSNLRYGVVGYKEDLWGSYKNFYPTPSIDSTAIAVTGYPRLFNDSMNSFVKVGDLYYRGSVDTILINDSKDGHYFYGASLNSEITGSFWSRTNKQVGDTYHPERYREDTSTTPSTWGWEPFSSINIGDKYEDLAISQDYIPMKYNSGTHLVFRIRRDDTFNIWDTIIDKVEALNDEDTGVTYTYKNSFPIIELINANSNRYGGTSEAALRENVWIPCGRPVRLDDIRTVLDSDNNSHTGIVVSWDYGDTYYQRWDCLKTYAFSPDDENQVVEIGSFMLESYCNIDGRYDRNRGQVDNTDMNPNNFNKYNDVYNQTDNFFNYKILDEDSYKVKQFPNQITWTLTKENGADIDLWTKVTTANVLDLDGNNGKLSKLVKFNDQLLAFQDEGISQILYNESAAITTTEGVPLELGNSGKVTGYKYITNSIGCSNKWSIAQTPTGIYFVDNNEKSIYLFNGQAPTNLSVGGGFNTWSKQNIPAPDKKWNLNVINTQSSVSLAPFENIVTYYDKQNQDVLFIDANTALAWSEKVQAFTSFYDYNNVPYLCNLQDTGVWIEVSGDVVAPNKPEVSLWKHNAGNYCQFFNSQVIKPYSMTLVGNQDPQIDKTFTNIEFRACVEGEGSIDDITEKYTMFLPFTSLEAWNEYQHGIANLSMNDGHNGMVHNQPIQEAPSYSYLKRKFRIWRCDIPRDNAVLNNEGVDPFVPGRKYRKALNRIRNPWVYLKLSKTADTNMKTEIHDIVMTYFD